MVELHQGGPATNRAALSLNYLVMKKIVVKTAVQGAELTGHLVFSVLFKLHTQQGLVWPCNSS